MTFVDELCPLIFAVTGEQLFNQFVEMTAKERFLSHDRITAADERE